MALVKGTNCGFVTSAPSADPNGLSASINDWCVAIQDTAPAGAIKVTEIGWYDNTAGTEESNFEVGIYDDTGSDYAGNVVGSLSQTNAKGTSGGWHKVTGLNIPITAGNTYWIALQLDSTSINTGIDYQDLGYNRLTKAASTLTDPFVAGAATGTTWRAIYAVYESESSGNVTCNLTRPLAKRCAVFDGVDDYVQFPHNVNQLGTNLSDGFTISFWINPKGLGGSNTIIDKSVSNDGGNGFMIKFNNADSKLYTALNRGYRESDIITQKVWRHFSVTISSASIVTYYKGGVLFRAGQDLGKPISDITTTNNLRVGCKAYNNLQNFNGKICQLKMWNRVLTSAEITKDYQGLNISDGLILNVPLANDYNDKSLTGLTGTNSGTYLSPVDDKVAEALSDARTTANDKYLMAVVNNKIMTSVIEEAP